MRIPELYITMWFYLFTYLRLLVLLDKMDYIQVNLIQLNTFELEIDFAEYLQYTVVQIADFCWAHIYHLPGNVISATVVFVYINLQP